MIKPQKLQKGDTIAIIAPSGGITALVPHRLEAAKKNLERIGFKVKLFFTTKLNLRGKAGTLVQRVKDIHDPFTNTEIKAIMCATGGLCANELLRVIDFEVIRKNPKIFIGYSDITLLHYAIWKNTRLVTFYGPCAITQFGEYPKTLEYTEKQFLKAVSQDAAIGIVTPSETFTDEILDWFQKTDLTRPRTLIENDGNIWLKKGKVSAELVGGCLHSIHQIVGGLFDCDYKDKILFLELPEGQKFGEGTPLDYAESQLVDLKNRKLFEGLRGLIIGRLYKYSDEQKELFYNMLLEQMQEYNFPILANADIGHTDPMITLPLHVQVSLDSDRNIFSIEEKGTE